MAKTPFSLRELGGQACPRSPLPGRLLRFPELVEGLDVEGAVPAVGMDEALPRLAFPVGDPVPGVADGPVVTKDQPAEVAKGLLGDQAGVRACLKERVDGRKERPLWWLGQAHPK